MEITMVTFLGLKFARKIPIFTISGQEPVSLRTASITAGNVTRAEAGTVRFFSERISERDAFRANFDGDHDGDLFGVEISS
jgi:hypothetical protein